MRRHVLASSLLACALAVGRRGAGGRCRSAGSRRPRPAGARARARRRFTPARRPRRRAGRGARDATVALRDLAVALPALRGADRAPGARPARPPDATRTTAATSARRLTDSPICDAQFCVHWTDKAKNAPVSRAFLDDILDAMASATRSRTTTLGWRTPSPTASSAGATGSAATARSTSTSPTSARALRLRLDRRAAARQKRYAYLVLDNDYVGFPTPPIQSMQVTVAHEYNHILQFNYDTFQDVWLFEDTATWAEEQVYPGINDYLNYMPAFAKKPREADDRARASRSTRRRSGTTGSATGTATTSSATPGRSRRRRSTSPSTPTTGRSRTRTGPSFGAGARRSSSPTRRSARRSRRSPTRPSPALPGREALRHGRRRTPRRRRSTTPPTASTTSSRRAAPPIAFDGQGGEGHAEHDRPGRPPGRRARRRLPGRPVPAEGRQGHRDARPIRATFSRITAVVANVDGRSKRRDKKGKRVYTSDGSAYRFSLGAG